MWLTYGLVAILALVLLSAVGAWWQLHRSLAQHDGQATLDGLAADVRVDFDAAGVPTLHGRSRVDVARALGFVHAQERFFQMDLARRRAAGELAELFGQAALATDRSARLHRFRHRADAVLAGAPPALRALVVAYADGVNAGLSALPARPFEYDLLGQAPRSWTPADTVLVVASMFFQLQDEEATGDATAAALHDALPAPLATFLDSTVSDWDTPEVGEPLRPIPPPGPEVFDLRRSSPASSAPLASVMPDDDPELVFGSNNWAVAGSRTSDGHAILANDMHLGLSVPNIWYRASLSWPVDGTDLTVTGASLPGVPGIVVGSNGHIAWGLTNTAADWSDRVLLTTDDTGTRYLTPDGWQPFTTTAETILVAGESPVTLEVRETIWGPVTGPDHAGRLEAIAWVPQSPGGLNLRFLDIDTAATLDEAMTIANLSGIPAQNLTMVDNAGHIAWTVAGRIPRRVGFDGVLPASWADGTRGWRGWYDPADYPRLVDPPSGIIFTANNRVVSGKWYAMLGEGGTYDPGARARQIEQGLLEHDGLGYGDMLRVHLDDRAILMARWRDLVLNVLGTAPETAARRQFRDLVEHGWTGHASIDSVGYRLVHDFRQQAAALAWAPFARRARNVLPDFPATPGRAIEGPVWTLLTERPAHLLDPAFADWNALMLEAVDRVIARLTAGGRSLADRTWGEANTLRAAHPMARAIPLFGRWLELPHQSLPGDSNMPRFQSPTNGASERMAVSPGHESEGYFHMPGGESGHPLSPNFEDGYAAWAAGTPTPFLPGPTVSTLRLRR